MSQTVKMSRQELDKYVRGNRPTGLLLRSVAACKGISAETLANVAGTSAAMVRQIFKGDTKGELTGVLVRRLASALGIDVTSMTLEPGQVHTLALGGAVVEAGRKEARVLLRGVGLLLRNACLAQVKGPSSLKSLRERLNGQRVFVAQSASFRAIIIGQRGFSVDDLIPGSRWARTLRSESVVSIPNGELLQLLAARDLTESEFDELFMGADAPEWEDIRRAARANDISKSELLEFIAKRSASAQGADDGAGVEFDLSPEEDAKVNPVLRVVNG